MSRNARQILDFAPGANAERSPDADASVLRFADVGLRYGRAPETLSDISFALEPGSFHFLTGPSGAGKSSLLKLIYMDERPSRGLITLFGHDLATAPPRVLPQLRRRIGVVFQEFRLLDHLSAFDNVALPLRIAGRRPDDYRQDVAELMAWVGLGKKLHAMPETLSGGEKQRVAIARAVVGRPDLLLADEPTGNVDPTLGRRLLRLFIELNKSGTAVIIATHDITLMDQYEARRLVLHQGRLHIYE